MHSLLLLASFCALCVEGFPLPNFLMRPPRQDSFYDAPRNLGTLSSGQVYNVRQVDPNFELKLSLAGVYQLAYKTKDAYGSDTHSVATVIKPLIPAQEHKLFSYQFWEDSAQLNCAPSYTLVKGLGSPNWVTGVLDTWAAIEFALLQGIHVVVSDHEGPKSAFIEGYIQGQAGLDGIQAALNYLTMSQDTPVVLYGYSGGASATAWMCNLHESYAPQINIVGAAYGGTPVDLKTTAQWLDRPDRLFSGFIVGAVTGLLNAFPDKNETIWPHLDESAKAAINKVREPNNCALTEVLEYSHQQFLNRLDVDFWTLEPAVEILNLESLLKNVSTGVLSTPKFPRYIFHAEGDEVIPIDPVEDYIREQCADGADIQWVVWKGNDHVSVELLGIPNAFQFIAQAFDGKTPPIKCGYPSPDILTLGSKLAGATIGQLVADFVSAINGLTTPLGKIQFDPNELPDLSRHI